VKELELMASDNQIASVVIYRAVSLSDQNADGTAVAASTATRCQ